MATHSSTLAWKIPWKEEPGRLQSMGGEESDTTKRFHFQFSLSCIGEGNGNPFQCSCLENPRDGGAWWAAIYGVTQSRTRLSNLARVQCFQVLCFLLLIPLTCSCYQQNLAFLCPLMLKKKIQAEFRGNRKMALIFSQLRGEHSRLVSEELRPTPRGNESLYSLGLVVLG